MLRLIVIGVLVFQLTPIGGEVAEAAIAMLADAPDDGSDHSPCNGADADHGCTALMHHCGCCRSLSAETRNVADLPIPEQPVSTAVFVLSVPHAQPDRFDLLRPPTA